MASYEMQESNLPNDEGKRILYPRMRLTGQIDLNELARRAGQYSTFAPAEIKGVVQSLLEHMADCMAAGYSVKIDGLGIFTPALGLRKGFERETGEKGDTRRNATAIHVRGINFRADQKLVGLTDRNCQLERSRKKFRRSSQKYTPEERLALARQYLSTHPYMTVGEYGALTGLLHASAVRELQRWAAQEDSGIGREGRGTHRMYVLKK